MHRWKVWYAFRNSENAYVEDYEFFEARNIQEALDKAQKWLDELHRCCQIVKSVILDMEIMGDPDAEMC